MKKSSDSLKIHLNFREQTKNEWQAKASDHISLIIVHGLETVEYDQSSEVLPHRHMLQSISLYF